MIDSVNLLRMFRTEFQQGFTAILRELRRERGETAEFHEQFFMYTNDGANEFVDLAAAVGATGQMSFRVASTSDFYATAIVSRSPTQADETTADQPYTYRVTEQSGDLVMSNNFIHEGIGTGSGDRPFFLPRPRKFGANSEVVVDFRNRNAIAIRVYFAFVGWKVYWKEGMAAMTARR